MIKKPSEETIEKILFNFVILGAVIGVAIGLHGGGIGAIPGGIIGLFVGFIIGLIVCAITYVICYLIYSYILPLAMLGGAIGYIIGSSGETSYTQGELATGGILLGAGAGFLISIFKDKIRANDNDIILLPSQTQTSEISDGQGTDEPIIILTGSGQNNPTIADGNYIGKNCPYCQFPFKQGAFVVFCPSCEVPHHQECWGENSGCTTYGCSSSPRK